MDRAGDVFVQVNNPIVDIHIPNYIVNNNLKLSFSECKRRNGVLVDDYGKTGISGQTLKIDSSLRMKWSV